MYQTVLLSKSYVTVSVGYLLIVESHLVYATKVWDRLDDWNLENSEHLLPSPQAQYFVHLHRDSGLCKGLFKANLVHLNACCLISSQFVIEIKNLSGIFKRRWQWVSKICFLFSLQWKQVFQQCQKRVLRKRKYICEALSSNGSCSTVKLSWASGIVEAMLSSAMWFLFCLSF